MIEKLKNDFQDLYKKAILESNNYSNPKPILNYALDVAKWGRDALPFLKQIEQDLIERKYVEVKIECWEDFLKYRSRYAFANTIQYYIASIIKIYGK